MKLTNKQIYEIIKIVVTAILSIAAAVFATSCTLSLSVSKNNTQSPQRVEHSSSVTADSASIVLPITK